MPTNLIPNFSIKTEAYEGPFELVLDLIEAHKLLINDLSLAHISDEFVAYIKNQTSFPIEETANFIQIAATLLLIKSKSLVPDLTLSADETDDIESFKRRLNEYEKVREQSKALRRLFGETVLFASGVRPVEPQFAPSRDFSVENIVSSFEHLLNGREEETQLPKTRLTQTISIEEMMTKLARRVESAMTIFFKQFTGDLKEKTEVIVSFLALLELVRQDMVTVEQFEKYGDIRIQHGAPTSLPRYE